MSNSTATMRQTMSARWTAAKPIATGLVIGLIAGPIISGFAGFQIRTSTAQAASRAAIVEQQAAFCAERARASGAVTGTLDYTARSNLSRQYAVMPGATTPDPEVAYACSTRLAS